MRRSKSVEHIDSSAQIFFKTRPLNEQRVTDALSLVPISKWERCMSSKYDSPRDDMYYSEFRKELKSAVKLGQGTFGQVYIASLPKSPPFVVKEAYLTIEEEKLMNEHKDAENRPIPNKSYPEEYRLLVLVRELIRLNKCPNYMYVYDLAMCNSCCIDTSDELSCYLTFSEPADGNMFNIEEEEGAFSYEEMWSILYQLLIAVHALHTEYGIFHNDIKLDNILYKKVQPGGWIEYTVSNVFGTDKYYVKNTGIIVLLTDFGLSKSFHPKYSASVDGKGSYGMRLGKVVKKDRRLQFEPISYERTIIDGKIYPPIEWEWTDESVSVLSVPNDEKSVKIAKPNIPIDYTDFVQFPAFDYGADTIDVVRMFTGGNRTNFKDEDVPHPTFLNVPNDMLKKLNKYPASVTMDDKIESVKWIVTAEMLRLVYTNKKPEYDKIAGRFKCK